MSRPATTTAELSDFVEEEESDADDGPQPDESRPQWAQETVECQCGADIARWHSAAAAREMLRVYGVDGAVVACPNCVERRETSADEIDSVPYAVRARDEEATCEAKSPLELAIKEANR